VIKSNAELKYIAEKCNIWIYNSNLKVYEDFLNVVSKGRKIDKEKYGIGRDKLLQNILEKDNWIIEGIYYKWLEQSFKDAHIIYVLDLPKYIYKFHIIKRFVKRKLKLEIFLLSSRCVSIRYFLFLYAVFILYKLIISRIMLSRFFKSLFPFFHKLNQLFFEDSFFFIG